MRNALWGLASAAIAVGVLVYGVYGDSQNKSSQESSLPFIIVVSLVTAIVIFGTLVPRAQRPGANQTKWGIGLSICCAVRQSRGRFTGRTPSCSSS